MKAARIEYGGKRGIFIYIFFLYKKLFILFTTAKKTNNLDHFPGEHRIHFTVHILALAVHPRVNGEQLSMNSANRIYF